MQFSTLFTNTDAYIPPDEDFHNPLFILSHPLSLPLLFSLPPLSPLLPDRVMPTQLPYNGIQYEWVEDQRPGFEGTAVVNITWEPQEGSEFITSYEITVFSQPATCGVELAPINYVNIAKVRVSSPVHHTVSFPIYITCIT